MPRGYDVVIVGAGVNGAATAFFLGQRKVGRIALVDRAYPGAGASSRGMGLLRTYHANRPEARLAVKALEIFRHWGDIVGGSCGFVPTGFLWLDRPAKRAALARDIAMLDAIGARSELVDAADLRDLQPHLACEDTIAVWEPDCGTAYGALATDALLQGARRAGTQLITRRAVRSLEARHGRVSGVVTDEGVIEAGAVVLAAGAWSAPLAATVGLHLPVTPRRLTLGRVAMPDVPRPPAAFLDAVFDTSFKPDGNGTALVSMRDEGYGAPIDPDDLRDDVAPSAVPKGIAKIAQRIPALADAAGLKTWTGVDGFTPDYKAIYGRSGAFDNLFLCAGCSEKGFKVSPAVGQGLARLIAEGACDLVEDRAFSIDRFEGGATTPSGAISVGELI